MEWRIGEHPHHPPASRAGLYYNDYQNVTRSLLIFLACALVAMPLAILGMAASYGVWRLARPTYLTAFVMAVAGAVTVLVFADHVAWLWPWGALLPGRLFGMLPPSSATPGGALLWRSVWIEGAAGPLLLLLLDAAFYYRERTLGGGLLRQSQRKQAETIPMGASPTGSTQLQSQVRRVPAQYASSMAVATAPDAHPPTGGIRLGVEKDNRRRPFDLTMAELSLHTFLPGATGSGKTTTLERLADGAMENGAGLVIIDCKGGSLGATAKKLAARHGLPFVVVDPNDPDTLGYEPCKGSPSDIANKLIGSFSFGTEGEIYKQVAMHLVPVMVQALAAAGEPITLESLADTCDLNQLRLLTRKVEATKSHEALAEKLRHLVDENDPAGRNGLVSLRHRFGALLEGEFRPLFLQQDVLNWDAAVASPMVVYIALPVTAASEDVELMGRVLIQDVKQLCSRRLRAVGRGETLTPTIVAIDEFAALKDARQIIDLLLQARQAALPLVLATQYTPQDPELAKALFQSGLLIVHRLGAQDAEEMASQFGTRNEWKVTYQTDWESGGTQKGSIRDVQGYVVHPNTLRTLPQGVAAVRSISTNRTDIVAVFPVT